MSKSMNKFLAAGVSTALVATVVAPAVQAEEKYHPFQDVNSRYDEAVTFLYLNEMIQGKTKTTFGTDAPLTRGDAAVILANVMGLDTENAPDAGFKDVNSRVAGSVNALVDYGVIHGYTETTYAPDQNLTRGAMAKFLVEAFGLEDYATETPFTDATGVFAPYIEALYGTEITSGKTNSLYGTTSNITRGEFAVLLYKTFLFVSEELYLPIATSIDSLNSTTLQFTLDEAVPEDVAAEDLNESFFVEVELEDGTIEELTLTNATISEDRLTVTVNHDDLKGKEGILRSYEDGVLEIPIDYASPVAGAGEISLEGVQTPVAFDFESGTKASVKLPATNGSANLNAMELTVEDQFEESETITVTLKDTDVNEVSGGIGLTWGTLKYESGKWVLIDDAKYDMIPVGNYVLEAPFTDVSNNTITLTLNVTVE